MSTRKIFEDADRLSRSLDDLKRSLITCSQVLEDKLCPRRPCATDDPSPLNTMQAAVAQVGYDIDNLLVTYDLLCDSISLKPRYEFFFDYLAAPQHIATKIRSILWGLASSRRLGKGG